jgi:2-keto-4-pentenoate hydratase/2-oxohepta-3-ene-1,7-dioic acid hydratase in catechol pathway
MEYMTMKFPGESFCKTVIMSVDGQPIPVGTIFCVGRNYRKHIQELKSKDLGEPIIFTKPAAALCQDRESIPLPPQSANVHHEVELAVIIGKTGKQIPQNDAHSYIAGAAAALDLTMRDIQDRAKKNGTPWAIAKGFDFSCPISRGYPITGANTLAAVDLFLEKNGTTVQQGNTANMIFPIDYLISYLSGFFTLHPGDIVLTGTPEGVGPIHQGDVLTFWSSFSEKVTIRFT